MADLLQEDVPSTAPISSNSRGLRFKSHLPSRPVSHSCRTEVCVTVMRLPRSQTRHLSFMLSFSPICSLL